MENAVIKKGAVVENVIIAPDTVVEENASINVGGDKVVLVDSKWRAE